jgi:hypothetical protein
MPRHVVVDGSNIATEGRAMPSLRQLNEAVMAYMEEHPTDVVTVVVDATFGHRIAPGEVAEFDAAIENNELVSPPAGAIGRGDAFVLTIANKANATILSNDSFQEFHGDFPWLFDEGRLVGGKPVPNVGWVFVSRAPVRGPLSRRSVRDTKKAARRESSKAAGRPSKEASAPMPVPKVPPPGRRSAKSDGAGTDDGAKEVAKAAGAPEAKATSGRGAKRGEKPSAAKGAQAPTGSRQTAINELLPFLDFVERHPVGTQVEATIESYSSHGAYGSVGSVKAYLPLRYLADPPPRSARDVVAIGERRPFVVASFNAGRRGIDLAVPGLAGTAPVTAAERAPAKKAAKVEKAEKAEKAEKVEKAAKPAKARKVPAETMPEPQAPTSKAAPKKAAAKKAATKQAVVKAPIEKAVRKSSAKKAPAKAAAATEPSARAPKAPAKKKAAAKKLPATVAKSAPAADPVRAAAPAVAPAKKAGRARKQVASPAET